MADMYRISSERLKGIADQARRLGEVSDELTPAQIESTLKGITTGGIPANAGLYYFGSASSKCELDFESSASGTLQEG